MLCPITQAIDEADSAGGGTVNDDGNGQLEPQQKERRSFETPHTPWLIQPLYQLGWLQVIGGRCNNRQLSSGRDADENAHVAKQQTEQQSLEVYTSTDAVEEKDEPTALPPCTRGCMCWTRWVCACVTWANASVGLYDPVDQ